MTVPGDAAETDSKQRKQVMKRALILTVLAAATAVSVAPAAEARGRGFHRHVHFGFVRAYPVYPVYSYCRWFRTPYGPVKRCFY